MYDESKSEPLTEADTPNHTKFHANDELADYIGRHRLDGTATFEQHYTRLAKLNSGLWNGFREVKALRFQCDNLAIFDAITSQLELTNYQKTVGRQQFGTLDLADLSTPNGIDATLVAIMVAAIVVRRDRRFYHPSRADNNNDPLFRDLVDSLDYPDGTLAQCYGKVLSRVNL
jgi:hypothetical protein